MERTEYLERVLQAYAPNYDIERHDGSDGLVAKAAYHEHGTGYILVQRAELWNVDHHEYVWFYSLPHLTEQDFQARIQQVVAEGTPLVNPVPGHMSTALIAVFLCDTAEEEALTAAKNCRIRKSFQFSLRGWMEVQTVIVELGRSAITGNNFARDTANFLKKLLHPQVEQKKTLFFKIK